MASFKSLLRTVVADFISLFYPDYCLGCSITLIKGEQLICTRCLMQMAQTNYHRELMNPLMIRLSGRIPLRCALAYFKFSKHGRIQKVLHALKYKNHPDVGVMLGKAYGEKLLRSGLRFDAILAVPLHKQRLRRRGYNQSGKFAEGLSLIMSIPFYENALIRTTKTSTQTNKGKVERWQNVRDIFQYDPSAGLAGKDVLLVDDVITTGATIEACAAALEEAGCKSISIGCIAVA